MNRTRMAFLMAVLIGWSQVAVAAPLPKADAAAVERLLLATDRAWDTKNGQAMAALFTTYGVVRAMPEMPFVAGRPALQKFFSDNFSDRPDGLRHVTRIDRLETLGSASALADASVAIEIRQSDGSWKQVMLFHSVYVAERRGQRWLLSEMRSFPAADEH